MSDSRFPVCQIHRLEIVPYLDALRLQKRLAGQIASGTRPPSLLLLQHPHTYTFGQQGRDENLVWSAEELEARGVEVHWTDRGGDVTYHGPGQLVGYPLIPLGAADSSGRRGSSDHVGFLRQLEDCLIQALAKFEVVGSRIEGLTGVWILAQKASLHSPQERVAPAKIASIGVKVDARGISQHGFSLNVSPDMLYWEGIVPCGIPDSPATSLAQLLDHPPSLPEAAEAVAGAFCRVFGFAPEEGEGIDFPST